MLHRHEPALEEAPDAAKRKLKLVGCDSYSTASETGRRGEKRGKALIRTALSHGRLISAVFKYVIAPHFTGYNLGNIEGHGTRCWAI